MEYKTFKSSLIKENAKIVSFPDHKGKCLEGMIIGITSNNELMVNYIEKGTTTLKLNGKMFDKNIETQYDINLIQI